MARILVTGAGGLIGRALCPVLAARGHQVIAAVHSRSRRWTPASGMARMTPAAGRQGATDNPDAPFFGDITPQTDWSGVLDGIDIIIHLAQRAHRRAATKRAPPGSLFRATDPRSGIAGILAGEPAAAAALARAAAQAGVRRFLYVSSIKAMGEATAPGRPFRADDPPCPEDDYGRAKLASERALAGVAAETALELVILRSPLVYGPGVRGNFRALLRLAGSGLPLPFGALANRRSLIFIDNLVDLIASAAVHPAAGGPVLLARDLEDFSVPALIRILADGQGRTARLFPIPPVVFAPLRRLPAVGPAISRLTLSLQVDDSATRERLGWTPPVAAEAGLIATVRAAAAR